VSKREDRLPGEPSQYRGWATPPGSKGYLSRPGRLWECHPPLNCTQMSQVPRVFYLDSSIHLHLVVPSREKEKLDVLSNWLSSTKQYGFTETSRPSQEPSADWEGQAQRCVMAHRSWVPCETSDAQSMLKIESTNIRWVTGRSAAASSGIFWTVYTWPKRRALPQRKIVRVSHCRFLAPNLHPT
jgi:hypothetical protein